MAVSLSTPKSLSISFSSIVWGVSCSVGKQGGDDAAACTGHNGDGILGCPWHVLLPVTLFETYLCNFG